MESKSKNRKIEKNIPMEKNEKEGEEGRGGEVGRRGRRKKKKTAMKKNEGGE